MPQYKRISWKKGERIQEKISFGQKIKNGFRKNFNNPSFTFKEQMSFASGTFGFSMAQDMVGTFLIIFLTDYMGIAAGMITVLMLVTKIANALIDPVAGTIIDRTNTRFGKARPYLLLAPLPLCVTSILLFVVPNLSMTMRIVWVFCFYIVYGISDTFYDTSILTVSTRMTTNPKDRKNFYTVAEFASTLGSMLPGGVIPIFISLYASHEQKIYLLGALLFSLIGLATMLIPFNVLREKNLVITKPVPVKINAKAIFMNRPLLLSMVSRLFEGVRQVSFGAMIFLYKQTLGAYWLSTLIGGFSAALSYVGIALVPVLGKKFSPRSLIIIGFFYTGFCYLLMLIFGYTNIWIVGLFLTISGATSGLIRTSRKVLIADSTDYMEWKTWKKLGTPIRSDGMVFAMNSMSNRITNMFKDLLLPIGLAIIGYVSARTLGGYTVTVVQTDKTLTNIFYLVTLPGVVGNFFAGAVLFFDNFTGKKKEAILAELKELHQCEKEKNTANSLEVLAEGEV